MNAKAMEPLGIALSDYLGGETSAVTFLHRDDGYADELPVRLMFRAPTNFGPVEAIALDLAHGHVLDAGAGAGMHTLLLQEEGLPVTAIDVAPRAVDVMRRRGVEDARCIDLFDLEGQRFDTILMLGHGIGMVQTLAGLDRFLAHAHQLLTREGQILLTSRDVRCTDQPVHLVYHEANRKAGRYIGEVRLQLEYKGSVAPPFGWLHVDPDTLSDHASRAGWSTKIIYQSRDGDYLAQLTQVQEA